MGAHQSVDLVPILPCRKFLSSRSGCPQKLDQRLSYTFLDLEGRAEIGVRKSRKRLGAAFRARVVLAASRGDRTIAQLTSQFGVQAILIYKWKRELLAGAEGIFAEPGKASVGGKEGQFEKEKGELFEQIGRLKMELEWVKKTPSYRLTTCAKASSRSIGY